MPIEATRGAGSGTLVLDIEVSLLRGEQEGTCLRVYAQL